MVENLIQIKSGIKNCVDVSGKIQQNIMYEKKVYVWNRTTCAWEIGEYLTLIKVGSLGVPLAVGRLSPV